MGIADIQGISLIPLGKTRSYLGLFRALGSRCEVLMSGCTLHEANRCLAIVFAEAKRIENKFTRFSNDSVTAEINRNGGKPVQVDAETARLLDCANQLWEISGGLFDITSGCLRKVWCFERGSEIPAATSIRALLKYIGWQRVSWNGSEISLPAGMELDFGGIGKEYACDRCLKLATQSGVPSILVNLGGDIAANAPQFDGEPWRIGIESLRARHREEQLIFLEQGGIATSGDTRRYLIKDNIRYSHVLDPRTGWPIKNAPASVTTIGSNCSEAGMCSTLAMLQGENAETFLQANQVEYWIQRREPVNFSQTA